MVPSVAPATPPVQGSIPQRFLQGIGKFLANPPGWEGEKAGIASTAQGVMQLPQFVAGARQQIPADVEALVTQPGKAIPEQMVRAGKMAWGMVPFHETMEEAASGKRPSLDTLYKGGTDLADQESPRSRCRPPGGGDSTRRKHHSGNPSGRNTGFPFADYGGRGDHGGSG